MKKTLLTLLLITFIFQSYGQVTRVEVTDKLVPVDRFGMVRYEKIIDLDSVVFERALGWIVAAVKMDRLHFLDQDYGKMIFTGTFSSAGAFSKLDRPIYSGEIRYTCTILTRGNKVKILFSNISHNACGMLSYHNCNDGSLPSAFEWGDWNRIKKDANVKLLELIDMFEGWMLTSEFDF